MAPGLESSIGIVGYLALFASVGVVFLFVNLLIGRFVRPANPHAEKLEIYECGEPTIGSGFVQFDVRFYVVALLFIIFDVEVAFFFPWATVFGKSANLADNGFQVVARQEGRLLLTQDATYLYQELGVRHPTVTTLVPRSLVGQIPSTSDDLVRAESIAKQSARQLAWVTLIDIMLFFFVLIVGFAYVWKRGDLDWVRAVSQQRSRRVKTNHFESAGQEQLVSV